MTPVNGSVDVAREKIDKAIDFIETFVGKGAKALKNKSGDLMIQSKDGLKEVRIDLKNPAPHKNPHTHIVEYQQSGYKKKKMRDERIYPSDVSPE